MSETERARLEGLARPRSGPGFYEKGRNAFFFLSCFFCSLLVLAEFIAGALGVLVTVVAHQSLPHDYESAIFRTIFLCGLGILIVIAIVDVWGGRRYRRLYAADLARGEVEVLHCLAEDAVIVDVPFEKPADVESGLLGYFLDLGKGDVIFLVIEDTEGTSPPRDVHVEPTSTDPQWSQDFLPSHAFTVVRGATSGYVLSITCHGEHLASPRRIERREVAGPFPAHGALLGGGLEAVLAEFRGKTRRVEPHPPDATLPS